MSRPYDPYRACALCSACTVDENKRRVCVHAEVGAQPIEDARSRFGACGPEANLAVAVWAVPAQPMRAFR